MIRNDLRNIAIIAHVDHGKTTLVDEMLKQGGVFRENQEVADRVMDNNDLERERGITILAKNTAAYYKDVKINIIDTPGHADFGGEVERVLKMVDGVLLLVDSFEGPMPQTRFVLQKALDLGHRVIVVVNKIDRPDARTDEIADEVLELLLDLDASEEQLDSPVVYCSGRDGTASLSPYQPGKDLQPLFETILEYIPAPQGDETAPLQMLVSSLDYNEYVGRICIGRIDRGSMKVGQEVAITDYYQKDKTTRGKIATMFQFDGLKRVPVEEAKVGDIISISGLENITIGHTLTDVNCPEPLPFVRISEPTVEMTFSVNDSPFAGKEGKFVTSRHLRDRLYKELLKDVSLRVEDTDTTEAFKVSGRGEMHLSILIETMRREGYEFQVSTPRVLFKEIGGKLHEPIEHLVVDVPEESVGSVMEEMGRRKGYQPYKGDIPRRVTGSLIAFETGEAVVYGLYNAQERGSLFIGAGVQVYEGMIVGQSPKAGDIAVNVCKKKHLTNTRSSGSDDALRLTPPRRMSLEDALEFIGDDELVEVTPKNIRLRKRILDNAQRMKAIMKK